MAVMARKRRILATGAFMLVPGFALAFAAWIGGKPYLALILFPFYLVCGLVMYLWSGRGGDIAALIRVQGDERQRLIDLRATEWAAGTVLVFCLGGLMVDLARGGTGNPWSLILAVAAASYSVALAVSRRRH